jgi:hypothetical protein
MRHPLIKPEDIDEMERWLFISEPPSSLTDLSKSRFSKTSNQIKTSSPSHVNISPLPSQEISKRVIHIPEKSVPNSPNVPSPGKNGMNQHSLEDPMDPEYAASYSVLEWIIQCTQSELNLSSDKETEEYTILQERLSSAQSHLNILSTRIQLGLITMEQYIQLLQERIKKDRILIAQSEKEGKTSLVSLFKEKIRLTEKELNEGNEQKE